jgi:riboflavin biosynthesis pyrimidine reductase
VPEELRPLREQAAQAPAPRLVVPTRSLAVDLDSTAFTEALEPPLVVTTEQASADRVRAAEQVAEVVVLGEAEVDLVAMMGLLTDRGATRVLCEGGPSLLAALFADDLVDELCLALAPVVAAGSESRITAGLSLPSPLTLALAQVAERDDFLFLRYRRPRG